MEDKVKWVGFDYGLTLMDPTHIRAKVIMGITFIDYEVDQPGIIDEKVKQYYELKKKYGSFGKLKEYGRREIYSKILENDKRAIKIFEDAELKLLKPPEGLRSSLEFLKKKGLEINITSTQETEEGVDLMVRFLNMYDLRFFFNNIITTCKIIKEDGSVEYPKNLSKADGSFYDKIIKDFLEPKGIDPSEAVIIGDKPRDDIVVPKRKGFKTIFYTGVAYKDMNIPEIPEADFLVKHYKQLENIFNQHFF